MKKSNPKIDIGIRTLKMPPYFSSEFFNKIREAVAEKIEVSTMSIKNWYEN